MCLYKASQNKKPWKKAFLILFGGKMNKFKELEEIKNDFEFYKDNLLMNYARTLATSVVRGSND